MVYLAVHGGEEARARQDLNPLREFGSPIADLSETLPYLDMQRFFDADYPAHEMRYYWKSHYLAGLPDDAVTALVDLNERSPSPHSTLEIWQLGGAFSRLGPSDTVFGDRSAPFLLGIESNWERPEDDAAALEWGRASFRALEPFATGAEYLNFPGLYEDNDRMVRSPRLCCNSGGCEIETPEGFNSQHDLQFHLAGYSRIQTFVAVHIRRPLNQQWAS
ncbi:MAG: hypothetical protein ACRDST_16875 [Pseudonocardiaceae bacterium]